MDDLDIYGGTKMKTPLRRVFCFVLAILLFSVSISELAVPVSAAYENIYTNTGDQRADIIGVALTQVGYREESSGYTKYGAWYGSSRMAWCGAFISWCANQANIPTSIIKKNGFASPSSFGLTDVYYYSSGRTPQPGDLFFRIDSDGSFAHAGIVYYVQGSYFYTLEGNTHDGSYVDGVYIRQRGLTGTYCFAAPQYRNTSGHTHNYTTANEAAHPHKEYKYCAGCNDKYYTGNNKIQSDCITCKQENCTHKYGNYTNTDGTYHKATCSLCGKVDSAKHSWTDGGISKEPTCKETGLKTQTCNQCKFTKEVTLPVTEEHTYTQLQYEDGHNHFMVCEVCEKEERTAHISDGILHYDDIGHWNTCADCGGRLNYSAHVSSGSCDTPCETCGYQPKDGHIYSSKLQTDEKAHWYVCLKCSAVKDWQSHQFTGDCDETCDQCEYTRTIRHVYDSQWKSDSTGHWKVCKNCNNMTQVQEHVSQETAAEGKAVCCADCGYEISAAAVHVHNYVVTSHNGNGHYGACACGATLMETGHIWDVQTNACQVCQEPVPATEKQSVIIQYVVNQVGVTPYLWTVFVLPLAAVLLLIVLIILLLLAFRKRSRNIDDDEYDDDYDDEYDEDDGAELPQPAVAEIVKEDTAPPVVVPLLNENEEPEPEPEPASEQEEMELLSV